MKTISMVRRSKAMIRERLVAMKSSNRWSIISSVLVRVTLSITLHPHDIFTSFEIMSSDYFDFSVLGGQRSLRVVDVEYIYAPIISGAGNTVCLINKT